MAKQIKPLDQQIEEYKNDYRFKEKNTIWDFDTKKFDKIVYTWNWDDAWDGQLIKDVIALDQAGFIIVSFSRKRKVTLKIPADAWINRGNIVGMICNAVGDDWYSISFKPTLSIYWKGRSSNFRY